MSIQPNHAIKATNTPVDGIRELSSPRLVQSASWQSASWRIRELSSYRLFDSITSAKSPSHWSHAARPCDWISETTLMWQSPNSGGSRIIFRGRESGVWGLGPSEVQGGGIAFAWGSGSGAPRSWRLNAFWVLV